jgi:hypothetical protein
VSSLVGVEPPAGAAHPGADYPTAGFTPRSEGAAAGPSNIHTGMANGCGTMGESSGSCCPDAGGTMEWCGCGVAAAGRCVSCGAVTCRAHGSTGSHYAYALPRPDKRLGFRVDNDALERLWAEPPGFQCVEHRNAYLIGNIEQVYRPLGRHGLAEFPTTPTEQLLALLTADAREHRGVPSSRTDAKIDELQRRVGLLTSVIDTIDHRAFIQQLYRSREPELTYKAGLRRVRLTVIRDPWYLDHAGNWYRAEYTFMARWWSEEGERTLREVKPVAGDWTATVWQALLEQARDAPWR